MIEETTIDWNAPLEAYHPDGQIVELAWGRPAYEDDLCFNVHPSVDGHWTFLPNGRHYANETKWRIRNRKPTASEHPEYSPELVEELRSECVFLLDRLDECERDFPDHPSVSDYHGHVDPPKVRLRAILSELDKSKEVDPLLEAFDALPIDFSGCIDGPDQLRRELDKRGYAITRKDEAA